MKIQTFQTSKSSYVIAACSSGQVQAIFEGRGLLLWILLVISVEIFWNVQYSEIVFRILKCLRFCMLHVEDCPGRQISEDHTVTQKEGGRDKWLQILSRQILAFWSTKSFGFLLKIPSHWILSNHEIWRQWDIPTFTLWIRWKLLLLPSVISDPWVSEIVRLGR